MFEEKLKKIVDRFYFLEKEMQRNLDRNTFEEYSKEYSELKDVKDIISQFFSTIVEIENTSLLLNDKELAGLAESELLILKAKKDVIEQDLKLLLIPKDINDERSVIIEIRAGTGGEEAALFASDLFGMYQRFAAKYGWRFEVMDISETGIGGYKEATANISGHDVFAKLKFESGVHRVQRVPETETSGRIHTSAATVAVLPEAQDVDIEINESDLRVDVLSLIHISEPTRPY